MFVWLYNTVMPHYGRLYRGEPESSSGEIVQTISCDNCGEDRIINCSYCGFIENRRKGYWWLSYYLYGKHHFHIQCFQAERIERAKGLAQSYLKQNLGRKPKVWTVIEEADLFHKKQ